MNFVLFCVNIAPVPGLDGGNMVMELLGKSALESSELAKGFMLGAFLLLFYCIDYIYALASWVIAFLLVLCGVS
jgi:Zn-dependent protease